jgi:hypothetical protein
MTTTTTTAATSSSASHAFATRTRASASASRVAVENFRPPRRRRRPASRVATRAYGDDDLDDDDSRDGRAAYERAARPSSSSRVARGDRMREAGRREGSYEYAPPARGGGPPGGGWNGYDDDERGSGDGPGRELNKFLVAGAFVIGIGAGVVFDTAVDLEPSNVASREILDRRTPSSELCMANGASAMVFDQRVFLSLNPFNVYVAQPEVKPGCVLRRSNWGVLERSNVVDKKTEDVCKQHLNTFAFVGDLDKSPEVSCVYHSEDAENQFMKDPTKAVLGDGVVQSMRERVDAQGDMKAFR